MSRTEVADARPRPDVRQAEALRRLRTHVSRHDRTESVPITAADGRVLAVDVVAARNVPHYRRAAMDGYAVRARDTATASAESPAVLVLGEEEVRTGTAAYVDTGGELPAGADAVARVEKVREDGDEIGVLEPVRRGKDVAPAGEDVRAGETVFRAGRRLRPPDLGVLRSIGVERPTVYERPTVAVVPTGEELVERDPGPGEVVETNGTVVSRYVARWGGEPALHDVATDRRQPIEEALRDALSADLVVTIGGSSVGRRDLLPDVVADLGDLYVHHVAIKPGHPVGLGAIEGTPVVLLPGYPVSCVLTAVQFVRPAVHWLHGTTPPPVPTARAELGEPIASEPCVRRYERVRLETVDGTLVARPSERRGAGSLTTVTHADGWVVVEEERDGIDAGTTVAVERWGCLC